MALIGNAIGYRSEPDRSRPHPPLGDTDHNDVDVRGIPIGRLGNRGAVRVLLQGHLSRHPPHRIAARHGPINAVVPIEHSILIVVWHMLRNGEADADPGADSYTCLDPERAKNEALRELRNLGYGVVITPVAA